MNDAASVAEIAPKWVAEQVLPNVQGSLRSVQMPNDATVIVFSDQHALIAEKKTLGGVKQYRADYPAGFLLNGSHCPHCQQPIIEPVGKVARLADRPKKRGK